MVNSAPNYIEVETSRYCNRSCPWCPNGAHTFRTVQELMGWDLFAKIVDELSAMRFSGWFALHNYNEPLKNPRLDAELAYLRDRLPYASPSIFTNGDFLDADRLVSLAHLGVRYLRVMNYPKHSQQTFQPAAASQMLHDWVIAKELESIGEWVYEEVRQGFAAKNIFGALRVEVIRPHLARYNWRGGTVSLFAHEQRTTPCLMTRHSASIDYRGNLKMCCNVYTETQSHQPYIIGSLKDSTFVDLWNSDEMERFRKMHATANWEASPICRYCTQQLPVPQVSTLTRSDTL